jgi:hypothetical protein
MHLIKSSSSPKFLNYGIGYLLCILLMDIREIGWDGMDWISLDQDGD